MKPNTHHAAHASHACTVEDLINKVSQMTSKEKEAFALRTMVLVESDEFSGLSNASQERCWMVLDLCTQPSE